MVRPAVRQRECSISAMASMARAVAVPWQPILQMLEAWAGPVTSGIQRMVPAGAAVALRLVADFLICQILAVPVEVTEVGGVVVRFQGFPNLAFIVIQVASVVLG
jgi:hypothetical protein